MWSVGCILAQMVKGRPIFPGKDIEDQMRLIFMHLGNPDPNFINSFDHSDAKQKLQLLDDDIKDYQGRDFTALFSAYDNASPECIDLIKQMLTYDPEKRITVD